jgi:hypothetical protein
MVNLRLNKAATKLQIPLYTLRDLRSKSLDRLSSNGSVIKGNGFASAFVTLGRAVYLDGDRVLEIWRSTGNSIASFSKNAGGVK